MDGAHDMGGMKGFGPVVPEPNEPVFHAEWEAPRLGADASRWRVRAAGTSTCRALRARTAARRTISARAITRSGSPGWKTLMIERGLVIARGNRGRQGAAAAQAGVKHGTLARRSTPSDPGAAARPSASRRAPAMFKPSAIRVRTKNIHPATHTRLPRYVRGHVGTIELNHGCHVFPDINSRGSRREPAMALHRAFRRAGTVGQGRRSDAQVSVDAWEPYLERV